MTFFSEKLEPLIMLHTYTYLQILLHYFQNFVDEAIENLVNTKKNKTVATVTAIKAAHNCFSLEKTKTFKCQNLSIITFTY